MNSESFYILELKMKPLWLTNLQLYLLYSFDLAFLFFFTSNGLERDDILGTLKQIAGGAAESLVPGGMLHFLMILDSNWETKTAALKI
jgi:hypothetical protein